MNAKPSAPLTIMMIASLLCSGCFMPRALKPMPMRSYGEIATAQNIVVLLPGKGDRLGVFAENELPQLILAEKDRLGADAVLELDAHFGYYRDKSIVSLFEAQVLKAHPQARFTLVGTSLGGFGATLLARQFPERIDRLILIAPFLGRSDQIRHFAQNGLVPRAGDSELEQLVLKNWQLLIQAAQTNSPQVDIICGDQDRLKPALDELQKQAPALRVTIGPGKHRWTSWKALFEKWIRS